MKAPLKLKHRVAPITLAAIALLGATAPALYSQISKSLEFIPEKVEFGTVREEDGKVTRQVKAVNVSTDTTFIISARTSCGCSAADYPETLMAPGDTVTVTVSYDPTNRPGKFLKTARFFTGEERIGNPLKMSGTVIPSKRNLDKAYPDKEGALRFTSKAIAAGEVSRSEARPLFVGIYNDSERPIALFAETEGPALEAALAPDTIEPFGIATLSLMLKGRLFPDMENGFAYRAFILDSATGDTLATIPVGGIVK